MSPISLLGNIIWLLFGGFINAFIYAVCGLALCFTVIGIPFGVQCFKIAGLVLAPFGREVVSSSRDTGCLSLLFNIIWIFSGGISTAIVHLMFGILFCITIVGIPFGRQHFKLIEISLAPFGKRVI